VFGIDLGQISLLIASIIGSTLGAGSLAIFYFAYDLNTVPLGVFAISFAVASFPVMSEYLSNNDVVGFKKFFARTVTQILFFIIPISVLLLLLRAQTVRLVLGVGEGTKFDFSDTRMTAQAFGFFVLSLFAQSLIPILARSFYALQNTVIPVLSGLFAAAVNIALALLFTRFLGLGADTMALAFSIASVLNMLILYWLLHNKLGDLNDHYLVIRVTKITTASVVMGTATFVTLYLVAPLVNMQTYLGVLIQTLSAILVATLAYLGTGIAIQLPEARGLTRVLKSWFTKFSKPVTSAVVNLFTDF
jgi:putative peptidoglycan lipid II flippase